ncbi:hypothetical protein M3J09_000255 [Ascochyta lentis]
MTTASDKILRFMKRSATRTASSSMTVGDVYCSFWAPSDSYNLARYAICSHQQTLPLFEAPASSAQPCF